MYQKSAVRIHTNITDLRDPSLGKDKTGKRIEVAGRNSSKLYYAIRMLDAAGSGWVKTSFAVLCELLKCGVQTIKRYLNQGKDLGLIRSFQLGTLGSITVYYSSGPSELAVRRSCGKTLRGRSAMKSIEFFRVYWTEWAIHPPYEFRRFAELTSQQYRKYDRLALQVSLVEAAEYAESCHKQNLIKYANRKRILVELRETPRSIA